MEVLKPFRAEIDKLDKELVMLLVKRMAIVNQVAHVKSEHNIPAILPDRVAEVRDNAVKLAAQNGLDAAYIYDLWTRIIDEACRVEERFISNK